MQKGITLLIILLFLSTTFSSAQRNFKHVWLVTSKGDTLRGILNDKEWSKNPGSIPFQENIQSTKQLYYPSQVRAAIIDSGDYYVSAIVHVDRNYEKTGDAAAVYSTNESDKDTLFLRVLLKSRLSLYVFIDENGKRHMYLQDTTGNYQELIYKKIPVSNSETGNTITSVDKRYIGLLKVVMKNYPVIWEKIDGTDYTEKDMLRLFKEYNQRLPNNRIEYVSAGDIRSNPIQWGVIGGLDIAQMSFTGEKGYDNLQKCNFPTSYHSTFGIQAEIPLSRDRGRYSTIVELFYRQYETSADYNDSLTYTKSDYQFRMSFLKLNLAFKFKYMVSNVQPYYMVGVTYADLISSVNTVYQINYNPFIASYYTLVTERPALSSLAGYDLGYFGSLGLQYKRFNVEFRYEKSQGFSNYTAMRSPVSSIYLLAAFQLNKAKD